ncbi:lytic transglycosylase domain-containing protein, partial [Modestobacter excelsi]|uniref:lytic transglycosylase domain-containing protein n=1 Tax=Modestobacter excelsi TaxID=2213161 RepID=UPI001C20D45F
LTVPPPETVAPPSSATPAPTTPPPADPAQLPDLPRSTAAASALAAGGIPTTALEACTRAADGVDCGLDWTLLAAIGRVESNHGRFGGAVLHTDGLSTPPVVGIALTGAGTARVLDIDGGRFDRDTLHDRAVGPMQFMPSTWARYGRDGNGDGRKDPFDVHDAAAAAARYLCAAGGDLSGVAGQARAVFAYNHRRVRRLRAAAGRDLRGEDPAADPDAGARGSADGPAGGPGRAAGPRAGACPCPGTTRPAGRRCRRGAGGAGTCRRPGSRTRADVDDRADAEPAADPDCHLAARADDDARTDIDPQR